MGSIVPHATSLGSTRIPPPTHTRHPLERDQLLDIYLTGHK